jgi:hypothetical protein
MSNLDKQQENGVVRIVHGRSCKGCTLCCKVLAISELEKPRATWCRHCDPKMGCEIHGMHPAECKEFYCGYLTNAALDERWAAKSKFVLAYDELHAPRLSVHVDPGRPNAWREEPYYSQIKRWAIAAAEARAQVIVWQGRTTIAVLPDRDKDLGEVRPDQFIITSAKAGSPRTTLDVFVVDRDHPIARSLQDVRDELHR